MSNIVHVNFISRSLAEVVTETAWQLREPTVTITGGTLGRAFYDCDPTEEIMEDFHEKMIALVNKFNKDSYILYMDTFARLCDEVDHA